MVLTRELLFIGQRLNELMKNIGQLRDGLELIGEPHDLVDINHPETCVIQRGGIELRTISFGYDERTNAIFSELSLLIRPGEKIGLVGRSGGGKTTITKLILRLMDLRSGKIIIDGQNIANIRQSDLRNTIAYVPQEPILFHRTLAENIGYGDLTAERKKIIEAAKKAHAHEFIIELEHGYDTLVGERGIKLSGGQKQRIAIARAILKPSPILILDEATSALDSESENLIQSALDNAMEHRTTLVIAHRLSTVQKMDRIIVLEKGVIVEDGSHEDLLKKNGAYSELWNHQYGEFLGED
jgi:ATP-binding cassette subfamily B protein